MKKLLTRLVPAAMVVVVTAGSAVLLSGVAGAVPPPGTLGTITINPPIGDDITGMYSTTSGPCPAETKLADLVIVGPVGGDGRAPDTATFPSSNPYPFTSVDPNQLSTVDPFVQQFRKTFRDAALERGTTVQAGEYHLTTQCFDEFSIEIFGTFTGGLIFDTPTHYTVIGAPATPTPTPGGTPEPTPTPGGTPEPTPGATPTPEPTPEMTPTPTPTAGETPEPTPGATPTPEPTPEPGVTATTTTLQVFPNPAFEGLPVIFMVRVSPGNAAGTVQLKDGTTNIGEPARVFGGFAIGFAADLDEGSHELTAEFTPTDPAAYNSSSDSEQLTVRSFFGFLFGFLR